MAFTSDDLESVESAIVNLATGAQAVQVSVGDKLIRYTEADLSKLRELRSLIQVELGTVTTRVYAKNAGRGS